MAPNAAWTWDEVRKLTATDMRRSDFGRFIVGRAGAGSEKTSRQATLLLSKKCYEDRWWRSRKRNYAAGTGGSKATRPKLQRDRFSCVPNVLFRSDPLQASSSRDEHRRGRCALDSCRNLCVDERHSIGYRGFTLLRDNAKLGFGQRNGHLTKTGDPVKRQRAYSWHMSGGGNTWRGHHAVLRAPGTIGL